MSQVTDFLQKGVNWVYRHIPHEKPQASALNNVKIIAHRGAWDLFHKIENTFLAFDPCIGEKIWAIEFDIRWTKDNVPVVHHDQSLERIFGLNQVISEINFNELRKITPLIPTLDELLQRYFKKIHLMIELKSCPTEVQKEILKDLLVKLTPIEDFHVMSLNINDFKPLAYFPIETFVSIGRMNIKEIFRQTLKLKIGGLTGQYLLLSQKMVFDCQTRNIKTGTGFPDCKNTFYREVSRGVDWVFTNHAIELSQFIPDE